MTTAARPTFEPARGGTGKGERDLGALSKQYSSRDLPSHTKLKYRQDGQNTADDLRSRDFRSHLEERERAAREKRDRDRGRDSSSSKRPRLDQIPAANLDADDPIDDDDDEEEDSSDDEDDTAALLAELQKIKKERASEAAKKEAERKAEEERIRMENIIKGNPLLHNQADTAKTDFKVKRRWDDDVVFKNCARGEEDKSKRGFINDSLRSEFHKKFMEKYIK
ncbi:spliceosome-associated protein CWC15 homolog [Lingula anatina]|uniref:Spliceosome-associated protein CWC15 homolog n=1 Tax=Lingula anatina TaxID=7574 RepID=A0A1S3I387_LINAN|nr:spliceosome-associated protein CWC15 homolog [Lingula anatina]|eukprot:XP_013392698.1 spliceosome-associated protein CWC15 homolog [Lingula anatina]